MRIRKLLGDPTLHFLLIGISLLSAYQWRAPGDSAGQSPPAWLWRIVPYAIGSLASFWLLERIAAL